MKLINEKNLINSAQYLLILNTAYTEKLFFSSVLHRQRAHRSLRADKAVSWYLPHNKQDSKGIFWGAHKTNKRREKDRQASTLRIDISLHTILKPMTETAMNPTQTGTLPALAHPFVVWHHFYLGKGSEPKGPYTITTLAEASQSPLLLDWHANPSPKSRASIRHMTQ